MNQGVIFIIASAIVLSIVVWAINSKKNGSIIRDPETGCEYIGMLSGGITPRMDADGYQICKGGSL